MFKYFTQKKNADIDSPQVTIERSKIIQKKLFLKNEYSRFYKRIVSCLSDTNKKGTIIELGSGGGFLKKYIPHVITSDVLKLPKIDMIFSATAMPFKRNSVHAFVMVNVLHHIDDVEKFFEECNRTLKKGGQIIMIEPSHTFFGTIIWTYFQHEPHLPNAGWKIKSGGPLSGANSALPWIVFFRDKKKFQKKFPALHISTITTYDPFLYLLSGGFTLPQLLPNFCYPLIKTLEHVLTPLNNYLGLYYTITLEKTK